MHRHIARVSMLLALCLAIALLGIYPVSQAQQSGQQDQQQPRDLPHGLADAEEIITTADEIEWRPGPPSLPEGSEFAVLEGDPSKEEFFNLRLKLPDGYIIPPHTHPKVERVTVISGNFRFSMGRDFSDEQLRDLESGSFFVMPPGMAHFAQAEGETIVQLNSLGPWEIDYIDPADDPRK